MPHDKSRNIMQSERSQSQQNYMLYDSINMQFPGKTNSLRQKIDYGLPQAGVGSTD